MPKPLAWISMLVLYSLYSTWAFVWNFWPSAPSTSSSFFWHPLYCIVFINPLLCTQNLRNVLCFHLTVTLPFCFNGNCIQIVCKSKFQRKFWKYTILLYLWLHVERIVHFLNFNLTFLVLKRHELICYCFSKLETLKL